MHSAEELRIDNNNNREVPKQTQEPLMVLCQEYLSDDGEEEFPWLR
jgi:hypothetical protein